ncbi:hypothetical protein EON65_26920 [archaeon]|nr:MAG: hypothetical protein EON65_26920 [archaeon]
MSLNILDTPSLIDGFQQASLSEDESTDWSTVPTNDSDDSLTSWHTVETEEEDALDGPFENEFDGLMYLLERNDEQGVRNFFFKNHTHYSPHILSTELEV